MAKLSDKVAPSGVLGLVASEGYLTSSTAATAGFLTGITGQSIKNLSDVYSSMSPTDGQVLTYDTTNGWQAEDAAGGTVLQVKTAVGNSTQYIASTTLVNVTNLSVTITPQSATSKILVIGSLVGSYNYVSNTAVLKDGSTTASSATSTSGITGSQNILYGSGNATYNNANPIFHVETSGNTTSRTYTIAHASKWGGAAYGTYMNNRNSNDMPSTSYMIVMEVE
jgi:hypothetical protein